MPTDCSGVTAIVPTFNRAHFLPECLASLAAQTGALGEIIVVDDGSTDATKDVVSRFPGVRYAWQANAGKAVALNHGLALAGGDAIWIVDDDDLAAPEAAARLMAALDDAPAAGFAFGDFDRFRADQRGRRFSRTARWGGALEDLHWRQLMGCSIFQGAMLVRRSCYEVVGPFDAAFARSEDYDMLLRLTRSFGGIHIDGVMFHQRQHEGERGPAHMRIDGAKVWHRQIDFDAMVLAQLRERDTLSDILPGGRHPTPLPPDLRARALLRRGAAMARVRLWEAAGEDVAAAMALAGSIPKDGAAARDVAAFSRGFRGDADASFRPDNPLLRALAAHSTHPLHDDVMRALSLQPFLRAMKMLVGGGPREGWAGLRRYLRITRGRYLHQHALALATRSLPAIYAKIRFRLAR